MSYAELGGLVLGTGILAAFICALLHRIVHRDTFRRYHEVGYAVFLQLGVIFAVLLAFVFNNVWSNYNVASQAIDSECGSLHGIAILSDRLPSPARDAILDDLHAYLANVLDREWSNICSGGRRARRLMLDFSCSGRRLRRSIPTRRTIRFEVNC
jgi:hypothetical protein